MINPLHIPPELNGSIGTLEFRSNLDETSITIGFHEFFKWHPDTVEVQISPELIHFISPNNTLVGIKVFSREVKNEHPT